jgi:NADPH2:quinone reductase
MKAIIVTRHGGPDVLALSDMPDPQPGPGQLLVHVSAAGVNYMDIYQREGTGRYATPLPYVPGAEGCGEVVAVGEGATEITPGDVVAWARAETGSYAEFAIVAADKAVAVPDGVDRAVAAAVMLQGMTAHYLATSTYAIQREDVVVVHAAAGGVGLLLTQIAKMRGATVVATTSTDDKARLAHEAGADIVVRYDEMSEAVSRASKGVGANVVYDGVGQTTFDASLSSLRRRGIMVLYGAASGPVPPLDPQRLSTAGSLFLTRPHLNDYIATRDELMTRAGDLFAWIRNGKLDVRIGGTWELARAADAHADLAGRRTTGKLLLLPA